ncbi:tRNA-intron lyase [Candidatus Aenigmatarchaeota archaeon]
MAKKNLKKKMKKKKSDTYDSKEWKEKPDYVKEEEIKKIVDAALEENKAIVTKDKEHVYEPGYFGKDLGDRLELALIEALLLLKRGRIRVLNKGKQMKFQDLYDHATSLDKRFPERYRVYEDLRERGLLVRTGYKFGCDFRVYERGVQLKKGPKSAKEHTKWIVFAVPEDYTCSFQELSRAVRLAHNIRARMLWAIVDNEGDCTYLQITRHKP